MITCLVLDFLGYDSFLSESSATTPMEVRWKSKETKIAQEFSGKRI